jgi:hypothetical protein
MLIEWIWKNRKSVDEKMLDIMERMAVATERTANAAEKGWTASAESAKKSAQASQAFKMRNEAEIALIQETRERLQAETNNASST